MGHPASVPSPANVSGKKLVGAPIQTVSLDTAPRSVDAAPGQQHGRDSTSPQERRPWLTAHSPGRFRPRREKFINSQITTVLVMPLQVQALREINLHMT
ncbi:hypothetical protein EVAR_35631_1 [Eumeta japonica]|uniref:Uncharacterized protein n=1 Tax=Eumeta variegata TaxID=151549 RepID=A0A4C1WF17_EUMVA|nr:hypothetical protein EVAR_35631_1 [Eumeta japonica]